MNQRRISWTLSLIKKFQFCWLNIVLMLQVIRSDFLMIFFISTSPPIFCAYMKDPSWCNRDENIVSLIFYYFLLFNLPFMRVSLAYTHMDQHSHFPCSSSDHFDDMLHWHLAFFSDYLVLIPYVLYNTNLWNHSHYWACTPL